MSPLVRTSMHSATGVIAYAVNGVMTGVIVPPGVEVGVEVYVVVGV